MKDSTKDKIKASLYLASFFVVLAITYFIGNYFPGVGKGIVEIFLLVTGSVFVVMIIGTFWDPFCKE